MWRASPRTLPIICQAASKTTPGAPSPFRLSTARSKWWLMGTGFLWGCWKSSKIRLWWCLHNPVNTLKTTQLTLEMGECYGVWDACQQRCWKGEKKKNCSLWTAWNLIIRAASLLVNHCPLGVPSGDSDLNMKEGYPREEEVSTRAVLSCTTFQMVLNLSDPLFPPLKSRDKTLPSSLAWGCWEEQVVPVISSWRD